jgi:tripartite-type tricarboxylate transporter receptor subunit TctC
VQGRITEQGAQILTTTPEELGKLITSETAKWRDIITKAGIKPI